MHDHEFFEWQIDHEGRMSRAELAIETLADAADRQQEFNEAILKFMASARMLGFIGLLVYALGQALLIARLS
mgnify:FL=1|jgi:hypothetical protein